MNLKPATKIDVDSVLKTAREQKFWFVDIPRTSSSSLRSEISDELSLDFGKQNLLDKRYSKPQLFPDHLTAQEMKLAMGDDLWNEIFTFTVIRNPWDRTLSMYRFRKQRQRIPEQWSFDDYVLALVSPENPYFRYPAHTRSLCDYIYDDQSVPLVDRIIRYEHREQGLAEIRDKLNIKNLGLRHIQGSNADAMHYSAFYNQQTQKLIEQMYQMDIQMFGYAFEQE